MLEKFISFLKNKEEIQPAYILPAYIQPELPCFPNGCIFPHRVIRDILNCLIDKGEYRDDHEYLFGCMNTFSLVSKVWNEHIIVSLNLPQILINSNKLFYYSTLWIKRGIKYKCAVFDFKHWNSRMENFTSHNIKISPKILEYHEKNPQKNVLAVMLLAPTFHIDYMDQKKNQTLLEFPKFHAKVNVAYLDLVRNFTYIKSLKLDNSLIPPEYNIEQIVTCLLDLNQLEEFDARNIKKPFQDQSECSHLTLIDNLINRHITLKTLIVMVNNVKIDFILDIEKKIFDSLIGSKKLTKFVSNLIYTASGLNRLLNQNQTLTYLDLFDGFVIEDTSDQIQFVASSRLDYFSISVPNHTQIWESENYDLRYLDILVDPGNDMTHFLFKFYNLVELEIDTYFDSEVVKNYVIPFLKLKTNSFRFLKLIRPSNVLKVTIPYKDLTQAIIEHPTIEGIHMHCYSLPEANLVQLLQSRHPTLETIEITRNLNYFTPNTIKRALKNNQTIKSLNLSYSLSITGLFDLVLTILEANVVENLQFVDMNKMNTPSDDTSLRNAIHDNYSLKSFHIPRFTFKKPVKDIIKEKNIHSQYSSNHSYTVNQRSYEKSIERIHQIFMHRDEINSPSI
ncbi:hypothetical protein DLAC_08228 [Tieghemostelium lacteum]|uniref:Uncharacterized protein n=1 Tax=Tieghemostelium lacteum TaxID=361077 RepID=A0A151ZBH2_TIELA|nr:hypothetical protein DLAC_08228 [Tieghemostelium lacteum]|eukprot:KYQ91289.1 hypothetical protein DLAC_08228 [Tieghemostelium lacteum]